MKIPDFEGVLAHAADRCQDEVLAETVAADVIFFIEAGNTEMLDNEFDKDLTDYYSLEPYLEQAGGDLEAAEQL